MAGEGEPKEFCLPSPSLRNSRCPSLCCVSVRRLKLAQLCLNQFPPREFFKIRPLPDDLATCQSPDLLPPPPFLLDYLHFFKMPRSFFPQVLCTGCSLSLEHPFPHPLFIWLSPSRNHLCQKAFLRPPKLCVGCLCLSGLLFWGQSTLTPCWLLASPTGL